MGRRRQSPPAEKEQPRLTIPRGQLREELEARITKGGEILNIPINSPPALEEARNEYYTWTEYNEQLLRKRFTTSKIADEYSWSVGAFVPSSTLLEKVQDLHQDVGDKIRRLESINERLELFDEPESQPSQESAPREVRARATGGDTIFVVHGHDDAHKQELARFLSRLSSLNVIILHEKPNKGRTIIEKFEDYASQAAFAIVLLTGDDVGRANDDEDLRLRGRQNVVFELGFFVAALGRSRVAVLHQQDVELPSDMSGVLYTPLDDHGGWKAELARELEAAKIEIDPKALL